MTTPETTESIVKRLSEAMDLGHIVDWLDKRRPGGRWVVWGEGGWSREFSTSEIEAYLDEAEKEIP